MEFKDYYAVLGIERTADHKSVRRAYRRLARELHPDVNPDDPSADDRFREISEAYEVLGDPDKRALYDRYGASWRDAERAAEAGVDFDAWRAAQQGTAPERGRTQYTYTTAEDLEELFGEAGYSDFFESMFGRARAQRVPRPRTGRNIEAPVTIDLLEAYHGATRVIERGERRVELRIPPGARDGTKVRMRGQGEPGAEGAPDGDLFLVVTVAPDSRFRRDGDHLETTVTVPLLDALLGGEAEVPTLTGPVRLSIPPETAQGTRIRLRGRGMPRLRAPDEFGDLYARIDVRLPTDLDEQERALLAQWRAHRDSRASRESVHPSGATTNPPREATS